MGCRPGTWDQSPRPHSGAHCRQEEQCGSGQVKGGHRREETQVRCDGQRRPAWGAAGAAGGPWARALAPAGCAPMEGLGYEVPPRQTASFCLQLRGRGCSGSGTPLAHTRHPGWPHFTPKFRVVAGWHRSCNQPTPLPGLGCRCCSRSRSRCRSRSRRRWGSGCHCGSGAGQGSGTQWASGKRGRGRGVSSGAPRRSPRGHAGVEVSACVPKGSTQHASLCTCALSTQQTTQAAATQGGGGQSSRNRPLAGLLLRDARPLRLWLWLGVPPGSGSEEGPTRRSGHRNPRGWSTAALVPGIFGQ